MKEELKPRSENARRKGKYAKKTSCREFWIFTELGKLTSDSLLIVVEAQVSERY